MDHHPDTPRNRGDKDAPHISPVTPAEDVRTIAINQVAWGAIFAGVAIGLITQLLLNMIGLGLGLATLDPGTSDNPSAGGLSIGAGIWWVLSGIIASFAGGWIAGRLAGKPRESTGGWHGVTSWAVTSLIVVYLLTSAVSGVLGGAIGAIGNAAGGVARTVGTAATVAAPAAVGQGDEIAGAVQSQVREATGGADLGQLASAAGAAVSGATSDDPARQAQAREQAAQAYSQAKGVPIEQARAEVARTEAQARTRGTEVKQRATQAADTAAKAASTAALVSAFALILGALAAWFGGRRGAVEPTITGRLRV
ncbi:MAG TPA: hypothetical protein VF592_06515 [Sphingomonas sp.]|jgi:hypothetical protein|uniref:hypothetical protein n=1 Tax=Sphingomonas sp. TaxID=28214 RepID=UPI002EDA0C13